MASERKDHHDGQAVHDERLEEEALCAADRDAVAVMLYGSRARGTPHPKSDLDVLQLTRSRVVARAVGRVNVTSYTPAHLLRMAERGSLFVLHLREEGLTLRDEHGTLQHVLDAWRLPADWRPLQLEIATIVNALLHADHDELKKLGRGILRVGMYALRTAVYLEHLILFGHSQFDIDLAVSTLGRDNVKNAVALRYRTTASREDLAIMRDGVRALTPDSVWISSQISGGPSLEAVAVNIATDRPYAASLLARVITGDTVIEYASLSDGPL